MNIFMIYVDALRRDRLSCYGYPKLTSPTIDRLASEGVRFANCAAVSTHTVPPIASVVTGRTPLSHGVMTSLDYDHLVNKHEWSLSPTPLEALRENGYLATGEWIERWGPLGFDPEQNDPDAFLKAQQGADRPWFYFASPYSTHMPYHPPKEYYEMFVDPDYAPNADTQSRLDLAQRTMICHPPGVISGMEAGQRDVIGEHDEAHKRTVDIIEFNPETDAPGIGALYDGEVRVFDDWLARTLDSMKQMGLLEDTLVVLFGDHGEELLDRGHVGHSSCNLMGTLYDESLMMPLILWHPGKLPAGKVVENMVSQIDIMPTIFELLGLKMPESTDGESLLPLIGGTTDQFREEAYACVPPAGWQQLWTDHRLIWCVRTVDWKLILKSNPNENTEDFELYNLRSDPGERDNCIDREPDIAAKLKAKLQAYMATGDKA